MQKIQQSQSIHLKNKYLNHFQGPILFTAPHSKQLNRGGQDYGHEVKVHHREAFTSYLAVYLAMQTKIEQKMNSFCIWGRPSPNEQNNDEDPNYIKDQNLEKSPFHCSIHKWALSVIQNQKHPKLFHIDIHGKADRKNDCSIDIGLSPMIYYWKNEELINHIKNYFQNHCQKVFENREFKNMKCRFQAFSPQFGGRWGKEIRTMSQQAIRLNIPSLQMQIPASVRKSLFDDQNFRKDFTNSLRQCYQKVIVAWYEERQQKEPQVSKQISMKVEEIIKTNKMSEELLRQLQIMEQDYEVKKLIKMQKQKGIERQNKQTKQAFN